MLPFIQGINSSQTRSNKVPGAGEGGWSACQGLGERVTAMGWQGVDDGGGNGCQGCVWGRVLSGPGGGSGKESYYSVGIKLILQDKILEIWCIAMLILLYIDFK